MTPAFFIALVTVLILVVILATAPVRQRRYVNLVLKVTKIISLIDPDFTVTASGPKHITFKIKLEGALKPWTLYFDAGRERFELDNPYAKGHCLLAPLNDDFDLTVDNLQKLLVLSLGLQNYKPTPVPKSKPAANAA